MTEQTYLTLNDGNKIPQVGLGVWQVESDVSTYSVETALKAGYRHIDTAAAYKNEVGVGAGIRAANVARPDLYLTTKLWNEQQGYDETIKALDESLDRLQLEYVDLFLIHWPSPHRGLYIDSWRALVELQKNGKARSIGVSNFEPEHLARIIDATGVTPAINQIELHPRFQQRRLREYDRDLGILTQSWSPLGQGQLLTDATVETIARKHGKTAAQVIIRWHVENGLVVIPKSVNANRIAENVNVFDFALDAEDMSRLEKLDSTEGRIGPNPLTATF